MRRHPPTIFVIFVLIKHVRWPMSSCPLPTPGQFTHLTPPIKSIAALPQQVRAENIKNWSRVKLMKFFAFPYVTCTKHGPESNETEPTNKKLSLQSKSTKYQSKQTKLEKKRKHIINSISTVRQWHWTAFFFLFAVLDRANKSKGHGSTHIEKTHDNVQRVLLSCQKITQQQQHQQKSVENVDQMSISNDILNIHHT